MRFTATLPALKGAARDTAATRSAGAQGLDPTLVAAQLGDNVKTVLDTYAHLLRQGNHAAKVRDALAHELRGDAKPRAVPVLAHVGEQRED